VLRNCEQGSKGSDPSYFFQLWRSSTKEKGCYFSLGLKCCSRPIADVWFLTLALSNWRQIMEDYSVDLCPWEPTLPLRAAIAVNEKSVKWCKTQDLSAVSVSAIAAPTPPVSPTRRPSYSLAHLPHMRAPFITPIKVDHEIGAASTYEKAWESQWERK
jgi:hypothetical protein